MIEVVFLVFEEERKKTNIAENREREREMEKLIFSFASHFSIGHIHFLLLMIE